MPPLIAVDRTQVPHLSFCKAQIIKKLSRAISIPNVDPFCSKMICIRIPLYKPKKLLRHSLPENALRCQKRERL